jgi:hypothetical protein
MPNMGKYMIAKVFSKGTSKYFSSPLYLLTAYSLRLEADRFRLNQSYKF